jgi:hypothetical protein
LDNLQEIWAKLLLASDDAERVRLSLVEQNDISWDEVV